MPKIAKDFSGITIKTLPRTTEEQLRFLIEERRHTKTGAVIRAIELLFQAECARMAEETEGTAPESFYISGPRGSVLQFSDGRYADTVGGDTSEGGDAHEALSALFADADGYAAEEPVLGEMSLAEMRAYVGLP